LKDAAIRNNRIDEKGDPKTNTLVRAALFGKWEHFS